MNIINPLATALLLICPPLYCMEQFCKGLETGLKISGINYQFPRPTPKQPSQTCPTCHNQVAQPSSTPQLGKTPTFSSSYNYRYQSPNQPRYTIKPYQPSTLQEKSELNRRIAEAQLFNPITKK